MAGSHITFRGKKMGNNADSRGDFVLTKMNLSTTEPKFNPKIGTKSDNPKMYEFRATDNLSQNAIH
ncbi:MULTISPECIES: hypothetical protein [Cysteiniphilum]|uniref:hypothetical protein n=1 Tax=Cysteiniphilum TaxID=2056696 RepID=UPI001780FACD|nr:MULTISPECIES: hypothetical protein [Cysteiniphilum]